MKFPYTPSNVSRQHSNVARTMGACPGSGEAGPGSAPACYKLHISAGENNDPSPKKVFSSFQLFNGVNSVRHAGSKSGDSGQVYKFDAWRNACTVSRLIKTPTYNKRSDNLGLDDDQLNKIVQYNSCKNLPGRDFTDEQIVRAFYGGVRGPVDSFSNKSRARLKKVAGNCFPHLISQYCLSYGDSVVPIDGRKAKSQLNNFFRDFKRKMPGVAYLWVLEFQGRKAAHFHLYLSCPASRKLQKIMTEIWLRVVKVEGEDKKRMEAVHNHGRNFCKWDMKKGGYLTKYLEKSVQKDVPANFLNVGRFWGSSRNLLPAPKTFLVEHGFREYECTDKITGVTTVTDTPSFLFRTLRRHHESSLRSCGIKRRSRLRNKGLTRVNLPSGGAVILQYLEWLDRESQKHLSLDLIPF